MRIVILTGSELRHAYMRKAIALAEGIEVARSYCEGTEKSLANIVRQQQRGDDIRLGHLAAREQSEQDFFASFVALAPDRSAPVFLPKGAINEPAHCGEIEALAPDLVVAYGCSLIREPLLTRFQGRFLNVHLGLSPYYRGTGTNFWPLVEGRPEYVGATFMHIDAGIDTGEVIHQIRAEVAPGDGPHQIGNRLIRDVAHAYAEVIRNFRDLPRMPQIAVPEDEKVFRNSDFSPASVDALYRSFREGMVERYLSAHAARVAAVPIVRNPAVRPVADLLGGRA